MVGNSKQLARNPVGENQDCENENEPTLVPSTLVIHGGRTGRFTKHANTFPKEGNKQNAETKARALNRALMGENIILQNPIGGGNEWGGGTGTLTAPTIGHQQDAGGGNTGWSALTEAVKMFGLEVITQEFSKKILKWQADVERESTKCTKFKIQVAEAANMRIFVGMVKWDAELKIIHSMLKWIDFFVAQNISGNVIAFKGDRLLEGRP